MARLETSSGRSPGGSSTCSSAGRLRGRDPDVPGVPVDVLRRVPLFADLNRREAGQISRLFKERRFSEGETVVREGSGGAAFFLIDSGEATVSVRGSPRAELKPGDYFGEVALIDEGAR